MTQQTTYAARWIFPVATPTVGNGLLIVAGDRIVAVEPRGSRKAHHDFGDAAIIPGLVNAHTHLDLTGAAGRIPPSPEFIGWLRGVIEFRKQRVSEEVQADIRSG